MYGFKKFLGSFCGVPIVVMQDRSKLPKLQTDLLMTLGTDPPSFAELHSLFPAVHLASCLVNNTVFVFDSKLMLTTLSLSFVDGKVKVLDGNVKVESLSQYPMIKE